jgi:aminoglycoside phosphotransferase (APT) family kinase protein
VSRTAASIASLLPDLASATTTLAERVADLLRTVPRDLVTMHGDFSPDQVVVDAQGEPTLIDLDAAGVGASAADLGCLLASTPSGGGDLLTEATLEGYALVRRPPDAAAVAGYALAYGLRKAIDPFRECAPDWPAAVTRRVQALEARCDRIERGEVGS